jgi:hypothetical protein
VSDSYDDSQAEPYVRIRFRLKEHGTNGKLKIYQAHKVNYLEDRR